MENKHLQLLPNGKSTDSNIKKKQEQDVKQVNRDEYVLITFAIKNKSENEVRKT